MNTDLSNVAAQPSIARFSATLDRSRISKSVMGMFISASSMLPFFRLFMYDRLRGVIIIVNNA
ncbi:MAG: hypothetical protein PHN45_01950 [Methylococcales bacterium]|nr:hypothetical protein [Methylococcales bacterium]